MTTSAQNPILCAIDTPSINQARDLAVNIGPHVGGLKLGLEFFNAHGPDGVANMAELGAPIFADLKFHDIPNTVAGAVRSIMRARPFMLNVHTAGGPAMMRAARDAMDELPENDRALLIGVTVLTSMDETDLAAVGQRGSPQDQVLRLARLAKDCGLDGVVCSAHEIALLKDDLGADFKLIVPGIRPKGSDVGDQKRIMTPDQAVSAGADYLVIGRPITAADDPAAAAKAIAASL
ncbi:MAG: orotidine-5'-phosphate decarboxylase [Alphaproteobacteria bacterium]